jgi:hypothetical protein
LSRNMLDEIEAFISRLRDRGASSGVMTLLVLL